MADDESIVIVASRRKAVLAAIIPVVLAVVLTPLPTNGWWPWTLFGLAFAVSIFALVSVVFPDRLEIDGTGFTFRTRFGSHRWAWSEVDRFRVSGPLRARFIEFDRVQAKPLSPHLRRWSEFHRWLVCRAEDVPAAWNIPPSEVVLILESARARWLAARQATNI